VDFTETQLFTLAPQSRQLVRNLQEPVKVWVFDGNQDPQDRQLLENYVRQGAQFSFEYVDPQARPGLAEKFGIKQLGEVYLEVGQQRRLLQVVNEQERLSEVRLTNGLQQITIASRTAKVYFLQGHGEHPSQVDRVHCRKPECVRREKIHRPASESDTTTSYSQRCHGCGGSWSPTIAV
jgi:ABC-type uncharacterized transport system involved in gliding motility auxiliary subunit